MNLKTAVFVLFLALAFAALAAPVWPENPPAEPRPPQPELLIPGLPEILSVFDEATHDLLSDKLDDHFIRLGHIRTGLGDQLDHWRREAVREIFMERYALPPVPWRTLQSEDSFRRLSGWLRAVNQGSSPEGGYRRAVLPLQPLSNIALNDLPAEQQERLENLYGTLELMDGSAVHSMGLLGSIRRRAEDTEAALDFLQGRSLLVDASHAHHQKMILNRINAAGMATVRTAQDTNKLLVALLEQRVIENKRRRDAEASWMNDQIAFALNAGEAGRAGIEGSAETLRSFRIR